MEKKINTSENYLKNFDEIERIAKEVLGEETAVEYDAWEGIAELCGNNVVEGEDLHKLDAQLPILKIWVEGDNLLIIRVKAEKLED